MKKTASYLAKVLVPVICVLFALFLTNRIDARADNGETVRVSTSKELTSALKNADVGTVIFRTRANISVTIKSASGTKSKSLIIDAPNASITNKAVFSDINIMSAASYTESVSGNKISFSDSLGTCNFTVAAKKKVESVTCYSSEGSFSYNYTVRKGAKIKAWTLVYAGEMYPVESKYNAGKKQLTIEFTNPYECIQSYDITLDKSGRMTKFSSDSDGAEFRYSYSISYDKNGNITKLKGKDNESGSFTDTYTYSGKLLQKIVYDGEYSTGTVAYSYDNKGRLIREDYSGKDSMDGVSYPRTYSETRKYDKKGRLAEVAYTSDSYNFKRTYTYDSKSLLTKLVQVSYGSSEDSNPITYTTKNTYNKAGDLLKEVTSGEYDSVEEYEYDELGELIG